MEKSPLFEKIPTNFHEDLEEALLHHETNDPLETLFEGRKAKRISLAFSWKESPQGYDFWKDAITQIRVD